jgi:exodeoxyribonuclease-3
MESEQADVVCLQEVKARPQDIPESWLQHAGMRSYWAPAMRRGYSGVAVFARKAPKRIRGGIEISKFDEEGRVLALDFDDFTLVNAYFPNSQRDHARLGFKLEFCEAMFRFLEKERKSGRSVVLCGDMNIAHQAIDLRNPKQNEKNAGYLPEERAWMSRFLESGYIDTFRELEKEPGHYTWWSYRPTIRERNIGWRLDYFVVSEDLRSSVKRAIHQTHVMGSDHCPVQLDIG